MLASIRFVSQRGVVRPIRQVVDGRITSTAGLAGHVLRLDRESQVRLLEVVSPNPP